MLYSSTRLRSDTNTVHTTFVLFLNNKFLLTEKSISTKTYILSFVRNPSCLLSSCLTFQQPTQWEQLQTAYFSPSWLAAVGYRSPSWPWPPYWLILLPISLPQTQTYLTLRTRWGRLFLLWAYSHRYLRPMRIYCLSCISFHVSGWMLRPHDSLRQVFIIHHQ